MPLVPQVFGDGQFLVEAGGLKHDADRADGRRALARATSSPRIGSSPIASGSSVESRRNSVVLPPPLGPRKAKISPRCDSRARRRPAPRASP